ncbi:DUF4255 domain-containing protein [Streptomyces triticiradicis]|uniref:DUF4255 domain-containing protein n=1 Tax=Streptomyces triticiradicis TaxID=2651189 RepID=UPI001788ADFD|nr:DUF4255 domain-containing protein [Streptomyces triticiradicis]
MSNHLAIATATQALCLHIADALTPDLEFAVQVVPRKPPAEPPAEPTITVFLYQVTPDPALRHRDTPTRGADGTLLARPAAALDLHYLISLYGDETLLVAQRLLGCVVRRLHEAPVLPRARIEEARTMPHLAGSDLAASPQQVRFTPTPMDVDDLSKLWSTMFQTPYALSVVYQGAAVFVESSQEPVAGKPVLRRTVRAVPSRGPLVDRVLSRPAGADERTPPEDGPVPKDHELVVTGSGLRAERVTARLGTHDVPVPADRVRDDQVVLAVPGELEPGVYALQLLHGLDLGEPPGPHRGIESNAQTFARRPGITGPVGVAERTEDDGLVGAWLALGLDMPVRDDQRVLLLLDEVAPPADRAASSHQFRAPFPLSGRPDPHTVRIRVTGVRPVTYLVRIQVDGVQSALERSGDGTFTGPVADLSATD